MRILYETEYIWFLAGDYARCEDGKELRLDFIRETNADIERSEWLIEPCSWLEFLIALSKRLEYLSETDMPNWFWFMIDGLGLMDLTDDDQYIYEDVMNVLDRVMWRTYEPDGTGGLFPLRNPKEDQRDVEVWYQLNAYLIENS